MQKSPDDLVTYFAETDARNKRVKFGIKASDRTRHMYVIGKTGMGKSTLLENMAVQDIQNGNGFAFMDPHGKTAELLLGYIPPERKDDVLYFAPFDMENPISFNIMEDVGADKRHLVLSGLMSTFKKIWVDAWSARMEYILSNTILALLEYPDATLLSVNRMYSDKAFRKKVVDNITDMSVRSFWVDEFAKYTDRFTQEATPAIQNKIGQFTSNPIIRNIIGQAKSTFDLRQLMDDKKIIIINLSKGRVGEVNTNLLGSMLITKIYLAAMSRADVSDDVLKTLPNFYLYVDEFQSFANESFADILSEARKYKLNLTIAHQYVEQMGEEVRAAVFGNVGTMITFRVGATDAEAFEKEFAPQFMAEDIVNLDQYQLYLRLMIDGVGSAPFSAKSLPPIPIPEHSSKQEVIEASRKQFAGNRAEVEEVVKASIASSNPQPESNDKPQERRDNRPRGNVDRGGDRRGNNSHHEQPRRDFQTKKPVTPPSPQQSSPQFDAGSQSLAKEIEKALVEAKGKQAKAPEPVDVKKPEQTKDERVSLNTLKPISQPATHKRKDKGASATHLAGLREALSSVTKDAPAKGTPAKPVDPKPTPAPKVKEKPIRPVDKNQSSGRAPTQPKSEAKESIATNEPKSNPQEVPQNVLENVLKVE